MSRRQQNNRRQVQHLDNAEDAANNVRVILRVRPLLPSEAERGETPNAKILPDGQSVLISAQMSQARKVETQQHRLDCVFGPQVGQMELFHQSGVEHYCESALEGMTSTVFCFGQTGSGKTYTMSGPLMESEELDSHAGLQYRAAHFMANAVDEINRTYGSASFSPVVLRSSYIEIYNETINDLLNETSGLKLRWSQSAQSFFIESLMMVKCDDVSDLLAVLSEGNNNRKRASHLLNVDSTRSHVIFTMYVERRDAPDAPAKLGKVHFIDLAGSEKLKDSESSGVNCDETKSINKSLFALGHVIASLAKGGVGGGGGGKGSEGKGGGDTYIPYRDSTLTKLLMDSLGGHSKTLMVACITPSNRFTEESLRTIAYAMRTKNIVNMNPAVRVDPHQKQVYEMRIELDMLHRENASLKERLARYEGGGGYDGVQTSPPLSSSPSSFSYQPPAAHRVGPPPPLPKLGGAWGPQQQTPNRMMMASPTGMNSTGGSIVQYPSGSFSLLPPGTAQSTASAPAALSGGGGVALLPPAASTLTNAANPFGAHWTTSSVRSLPAMTNAPNVSKLPPSLSTEQYAQQAISNKVQHDNEELRREVAELRSMILAIKQGDPNLSPTKRTQGRSLVGASSLSTTKAPHDTEDWGSMRDASPPTGGSPLGTFERRSSTDGTTVSADGRTPAGGAARVNGEATTTTSLTTFGFKPAPKKVQKLMFPS